MKNYIKLYREDFLLAMATVVSMAMELQGRVSDGRPVEVYSLNNTLVKMLSDPRYSFLEPWDKMDEATHALGQVAYNIKSVFYQRIVAVRRSCRMFSYVKTNVAGKEEPGERFANLEEAYKYFFPRKELEQFISEFLECFDLLMTEIELMPESSRSGIWAKAKDSSNDGLKVSGGSSKNERAAGLKIAEMMFSGYTDMVDDLAIHFDTLAKSIEKGVFVPLEKSGVGEIPLGYEKYNALERLLQAEYVVIHEKSGDMGTYFDDNGAFKSKFIDKATSEGADFRSTSSMMFKNLSRFLASAAALAHNIGSESADMFSRASELIGIRSGLFRVERSDERAKLYEFMETLQKAQVQLLRDLEIAKLGAKPPMSVEFTADSVRKLADATGKSVKRAIRPGKGSANERYALKDELMRIWEKYSKDETLKGSLNHKVRHLDVFNYSPANLEIAALRKDPPITLEEFERALGAYSDRKSRQSPAKSNKPR